MSVKFGRNYLLNVETANDSVLTIQPPFTIEIDITRNSLSASNICSVRVYNLSILNRNQIFYNVIDQSDLRQMTLLAGYGNNLATIFSGNISRAWSVREGTNFISQIEGFDGGFALVNGDVSLFFPALTPLQLIIQTLMTQLPGVTPGAIGLFPGVIPKANTYTGSPAKLLSELTGGAFYIDNGKAYCLGNTTFVATLGLPILINADTGLLNTPILEQTICHFEMLFEPSLNVGCAVVVVSTTFPQLNGTWKVISVKHKGIISEAVSGNLITVVGLQNNATIPAASIPA